MGSLDVWTLKPKSPLKQDTGDNAKALAYNHLGRLLRSLDVRALKPIHPPTGISAAAAA